MLSIKKIFKNNFIMAVSLNLFYMIMMITCFEQFATYDDYTMAVQFASGIGEEYVHGHTFVSPLYGKLVVFLNNTFPFLPWFNILFTAIVFVSLTLLTYDILQKEERKLALFLCNLIIIFFSYEGYVGTCFTKIAGIASVCGIYILLCGRRRVANILLALAVLSLGILLRNEMMFMALAAAVVYIVYYYVLILDRTKKLPIKELIGVGITLIICVSLYIIFSNEKLLFGDDYPMYQKWLDDNSYRSRIQDYPIPEYEDNIYGYESVDITDNDLSIFYGWNYDRHKLDKEVYKAIETMEQKGPSFLENVFSIENICDFFKYYPKYFFEMDVWYCFIIIILTYIMLCKKDNFKYILLNGVFAIALNFLLMYYLYIQGRYNQHRVDIAIELAIIIGFIVLCREYMNDIEINVKKSAYILTSIMLLLVPYNFHDDFWWGVIGDDLKAEITQFYDKTSEDKEHFYLLGNQRGQADIFMMYSLWDITKDAYEDKFINTSLVSNFYQADYLQESGVDDVYKEIVNSDKIRFVLNESNWEIGQWEEYFSHRYGEPVKLVQVQSGHWKKVYSVVTEGNYLENISLPDTESDLINEDFVIEIKKKKLTISGNIYVHGIDEFGQRIFLRVKDSKTNKVKDYLLLVFEDEELANDEAGHYSKVDQRIDLPSWYSKKDEIFLVVENDGEYYMKLINRND